MSGGASQSAHDTKDVVGLLNNDCTGHLGAYVTFRIGMTWYSCGVDPCGARVEFKGPRSNML